MIKNYRDKKGITLVILVITIIILLILAGITINSLTESGLFKNAKLAKEKSENAQKLENETLGDYQNTVNEYIIGISRDMNIHLDYSNAFNPFEFEEEGTIQPAEYVALCDGLLILPLQMWNRGEITILINNKISLHQYDWGEACYNLPLSLSKGDTLKFTYGGNVRLEDAGKCWMIPNK